MDFNFKRTLTILITISLLSSCKKNDSDAVTPQTASRVKTYIEEVTNFSNTVRDTFNVSYDGNGRVVSLISTFSGAQFLYTYLSNSSYTFQIKNGTHLVIHANFYNNNDLLVDTCFQYNDTKDSTTLKFIYNANRQITEQKAYDYSLPGGAVLFRKNVYTYNNEGNVLTDAEMDPAGNINYTKTYTYTNFTGSAFFLSTIYSPVLYKKLPATISTYYPGTNTTVPINFSYVFDNNNRLIKETQVNSVGNTAIKQYIYY
ncbi:MAG TPA: hypothetical protein VK489_14345 [Ferruginibacter sp.]|nr:hypothetical protein [Ferruginibacter sp.]